MEERQEQMKLYAISGLGADKRVFQHLNLKFELIHLDWIKPIKNEPIENYARRLSDSIATTEPFGIIGVSFGGLIAVEITKLVNPMITILISSAETKHELRKIYRLFGKTHFIKLMPRFAFNLPRTIANYLFGASNKKLLKDILDDSDMYFTKWAVSQLIRWQNMDRIRPIIKINGTKDKLIPADNHKNTVAVKDGEHFMIVDMADEITELINHELKGIVRGKV